MICDLLRISVPAPSRSLPFGPFAGWSELPLATGFEPRAAGSHRDAISPAEGGFHPSARTDFVEKRNKRTLFKGRKNKRNFGISLCGCAVLPLHFTVSVSLSHIRRSVWQRRVHCVFGWGHSNQDHPVLMEPIWLSFFLSPTAKWDSFFSHLLFPSLFLWRKWAFAW